MSASPAFLVHRFDVGPRVCTLTIPQPRVGSVMSFAIEWSPSVPSDLTAEELQAYRAGRNQALAEVGRALGGCVAVVEV